MLEIAARSKVKVKIYGKELELTKPTVGDVEKLQGALSDATTDLEKFRVTKQFVISRGVPKEVAESMEMDHFTQLVEHLSGAKKN